MATALTQADIDKLEKAIARGVRRVTYQNGTVEYQSTAEMMQALTYAKSVVSPADSSMTSLASFARE